MSPIHFIRVVTLVQKYNEENMKNAQGDNGQDVRNRAQQYAAKLDKLLSDIGYDKRKITLG